MQIKLYHYEITRKEDERVVGRTRHFDLFNKSKGVDDRGNFAPYRKKRDSVLMHVQKYRDNFGGLIGRHSTERDVTKYDPRLDVAQQTKVSDDDYPHAAFVVFPHLKTLACIDGSEINANSAISRLHAILIHRQHVAFAAESIRHSVDLRKAEKQFRLLEVDFEVLPVNPHTGDLGVALDESRKRDHIKKFLGKVIATASEPLRLNGGLLSQVQELQQSGHCRAGFTGVDDKGATLKVPKPQEARALSAKESDIVPGTSPEVKITIEGPRWAYPFDVDQVNHLQQIARLFRMD